VIGKKRRSAEAKEGTTATSEAEDVKMANKKADVKEEVVAKKYV